MQTISESLLTFNMFTPLTAHHGDAHGAPDDGNSIMVALRMVPTHGTPHPNDDYYPLTTSWKPVPFRFGPFNKGRVGQDQLQLEEYLKRRQAQRPQTKMPTIKYVPPKQARTFVSSRGKPARHVLGKGKSKKVKKIQSGVKNDNTTFGSKKLKFMNVKQLEEALLKELKCTVLPTALETVKGTKAWSKQSGRIRQAINRTVTGIISDLDPYALAHTSKRMADKDRNVDARIKTALRHTVKTIMRYRDIHAHAKEEHERYNAKQGAPIHTCL